MSFSDKSSLYREVLAIDPGSRIFLPYARMLAAEGQYDAAAEVLAKGLSAGPEFLEARLFLIEVLHNAGRDNAAIVEASSIIDALSAAPAFWKIWSRHPGVRADQAAMLLFLSACMRSSHPVSLSDVFEAGIHAVTSNQKDLQAQPSATPMASLQSDSDSLPAQNSPRPSAEPPSETVQEEDSLLPWCALDEVPDEDDLPDDSMMQPVSPAVLPSSGKTSLCTRTMAMLLEEQGASDEAAGIYRELLRSSASPEERAELAARIESLAQDGPAPSTTQPQLVNILERLAERLENRSRA